VLFIYDIRKGRTFAVKSRNFQNNTRTRLRNAIISQIHDQLERRMETNWICETQNIDVDSYQNKKWLVQKCERA